MFCYLCTYILDLFPRELVTKVKPNIKHLADGELMGVGSPWSYIGILHHSVLGEKQGALLNVCRRKIGIKKVKTSILHVVLVGKRVQLFNLY
jgi:hypothetical protein